MRENFIKGMFFASFLGILIGAAAVDSDPVKGLILLGVSFGLAALIYVQNEGGRIWR